MSIVGDLLYASPEFAQSFLNKQRDDFTLEEM